MSRRRQLLTCECLPLGTAPTTDSSSSANTTALLGTYAPPLENPHRKPVAFDFKLTWQHAVRLLNLEDYEPTVRPKYTSCGTAPLACRYLTYQGPTIPRYMSPRRRWITRIIRNVSGHARSLSAVKHGRTRHKRSLSDMTAQNSQLGKELKDVELEEIIRICGKNLLRLPPEHAPSSLVVPTCVRATAHYLVQNGKRSGPHFHEFPGRYLTQRCSQPPKSRASSGFLGQYGW